MSVSFRSAAVPHLWLLLASSLAINLLALALPLMTMQIYNRILPGRAVDTLFVLSAAVLVAASMEFLLKMARHRILAHNSVNFETGLMRLLIKRVLSAHGGSYRTYPAAQMLQDVQSASQLKDHHTGIIATTLLLDIPFIVMLMALMLWLAGWLALIPLLTMLMYGAILRMEGQGLQHVVHMSQKQGDRRYNFITQTLHAVHTIKANCLEAVTARRFEALQASSARLGYTAPYLSGRMDIINTSMAQLMTIALIVCGAPLVLSHTVTIGTLIAAILLAGQIVQPFQRSMALILRDADSRLAEQRISRLLDLAQPHPQEVPLPEVPAAIELRNISILLEGGRHLLDNVTFRAEPGDCVVIGGSSGSGKSSLLEILCGFQQPKYGRALYGDVDIATIPTGTRRRHIAYLPAQSLILRGSIMDNLTGFDSHLQAAAQEVSMALGIDRSVALLRHGYDTMLDGMNSDVISHGLRQRIAIARALLHNPDVILFDNADHGLDKESRQLVIGLLRHLRGKSTLVIVSEDPSITCLADRIYAIDEHQLNLVQDTTGGTPALGAIS